MPAESEVLDFVPWTRPLSLSLSPC